MVVTTITTHWLVSWLVGWLGGQSTSGMRDQLQKTEISRKRGSSATKP